MAKAASTPVSTKNDQRDIEFLYEVGCLRFIQRTWRQFLNPDFSNLAEHHYRVMWIALMIAKHEQKVDTEKVLKMALVHDLSESRSVDVHYVSRQYAERFEEAAVSDTLADTALEAEFVELWKEYEKQECLEAKIVKDADNLDVDFELRERAAEGNQLEENWVEMRTWVKENKLNTQTAKKMWQEIKSSNPHAWHINAKNRFKAGDWKKR